MNDTFDPEALSATTDEPASDPAAVFVIMVKVPGRKNYQHFANIHGGRLTVLEHATRFTYTDAAAMALAIELKNPNYAARVVSLATPKYPKAVVRLEPKALRGDAWPIMKMASTALLKAKAPPAEVDAFLRSWRAGSFDDFLAGLAGLVTLVIELEAKK